MKENPKVFIIVLNWNGLEDTLVCLESVFRLTYDNFEVIVVDNGSVDGSVRAISSKYPAVTIIQNGENLGYTGGNNAGIKHSLQKGADYVWLLNNDTEVEPDSLGIMVATAEESLRLGLISPIIYHYHEPSSVQFCGSYIDWDDFDVKNYDISRFSGDVLSEKWQVSWGTALLIKREALEEAGYLNDDYFAYHEDLEFSLRSKRAGYGNAVDRRSKIYHKESRSTGNRYSPMQVFLRVRNRYFLWKELLEGIRKLRFLRLYLEESISYSAMLRSEGHKSASRACLDGIWAGILGRGGRWDERMVMPAAIKNILSWHPYFWVALLKGNFRNIVRDTLTRVLSKRQER